jgi:hypothetical protein
MWTAASPGVGLRRFEAARDVRAAARRDDDGVGVDRHPQDLRHRVLGAGADDDVREPPGLAAPVLHEVAQALALGVDQAVEGIGGDVPGADGGFQGGAEPGRHAGLGDAQVPECDPW